MDLSRFGHVAVHPRGGAYVTTSSARGVFFDSIYHSAAVVGINTSAMIEAGIVGRVSHTIITSDFADTQEGTLHFDYLVRDGFVKVARDLAEHNRQLRGTLDAGADGQAHVRAFVQNFIRPQGIGEASTPRVANAIEELARMQATPARIESFSPAVKWLVLTPLAASCWSGEFVLRACRKAYYTVLFGAGLVQKLFTGKSTLGKKPKPKINVSPEKATPTEERPPLRKSA
jgi:hypothetical protein